MDFIAKRLEKQFKDSP